MKWFFFPYIIIVTFFVCFWQKAYSFEYKIANGKDTYLEELKVIKRCCQNTVLYSKEFQTSIPCKNASAEAQKCLRDTTQKISKGAFNNAGIGFMKELHPVARQYISQKCNVQNIIFDSLKQSRCIRKVVTGGDDPADEHFDFVSAMADYAIDNKVALNINYDAVQNSFNRYMNNYNKISILRGACSKTLNPGDNDVEKCGGHSLDFNGDDIAFSPTPEITRKDKELEELDKKASGLPSAFSGTDLLDGEQKELLDREAAERDEIQESIRREGIGGEFKCGEALLRVDESSPLCVDWKNYTSPLPITTQFGLYDIGKNVFYKDLVNFAAQKVWRSYALGLISDPSFSDRPCPKGDKGVKYDEVRNDLLSSIETDYSTGRESLLNCLEPKGIFSRGAFVDAVESGVKVRCDQLSDGSGGCSDESLKLSKTEQRKKEVERFKKRLFQLKEVRAQLNKLKNGQLNIPGKNLKCSDRFETCAEFLEHQDNCEKRFTKKEFDNGVALTRGCISSKIMKGPYREAFEMYKSLTDLENYILTKNPALASRVKDKNGDEVFFYETLEDKSPKDSDWDKIYDQGHRKSRKDSAKFLLGTICDDPNEFAEMMLLKNPALVNEYLAANNSPHLKNLMCHMKAQVNIKQKFNNAFHMTAIGATVLLGAAAAIPTGGTSLAWGLGTAATIGGLGLAGHTLYSARHNLQMETGMLHGCIGDFNRMQEAEDAVDDAMIGAILELAIPFGVFAGLKAFQKLKKLNDIRKHAHITKGIDPAFATHLDDAVEVSAKVSKGQRQLIAKNYQLDPDTPDEILRSINMLEQKGFSPTQIKKMLGKNCTL